MKKLLLAVFVLSAVAAIGLSFPAPGSAEVSVSITVPMPGLVFPAPPGLVVVPGTYVYYPPEARVDIFFYHGYWYRPYGGRWYIGAGYNGPWRMVGPGGVPRPLLGLPPGYRRIPPRHDHIPYPVVQRNWRTWERERHWDRGYYRGHGEHGGGEHDQGRGRGGWHDRG